MIYMCCSLLVFGSIQGGIRYEIQHILISVCWWRRSFWSCDHEEHFGDANSQMPASRVWHCQNDIVNVFVENGQNLCRVCLQWSYNIVHNHVFYFQAQRLIPKHKSVFRPLSHSYSVIPVSFPSFLTFSVIVHMIRNSWSSSTSSDKLNFTFQRDCSPKFPSSGKVEYIGCSHKIA